MSNHENDQIKRQICVMGNKENTWKKYFYIENGVLIKEQFVKIENGIEIPCEETTPAKYTLELPQNFEKAENLEIVNTETKTISRELVKNPPKKQECVCLKIFNKTKNIGEMHKLIDGIVKEITYFKIENGKEVFCDNPQNNSMQSNYFAPILPNLEGPLSVYDNEGNLLINIPYQTVASLDGQTEIAIQHEDKSKIKEMLYRISSLSEEDKEKLKLSLENKDTVTTLEGKQLSRTPYNEIERAVDAILSTSVELVSEDFYKSVDPSEEFGISRFVVDRFYHLPQLLSEPILTRQPNTTTYIVNSKTSDSQGNGICLEHRFQATSQEEATKLAKLIIKRLQGVQHKIWLAAWRLANELKKYTYTCALTELMRLCHPERNAYFQTKEKIEFYEHLKSLENTKIIFTRKRKKSLHSKKEVEDFIEIRALEIAKGTRKPDEKYPESITITVLNTISLQNEKMAFVGAGYKHRTLELHADDSLLAQVIQTRKNQMQNSKHLKFNRDYLIKLAGLSKTDKSNKSEANRLLVEKLNRIHEKGILINSPKRIREPTILKIR